MRIVHIIDSLEAGGAERMAVNYANALTDQVSFSGLVTTRAEGPLKNSVSSEVSYLFIDKKATIDFSAIRRLFRFIKNNEVDVLHAHSTSLFMAVLLKLMVPRLKIIWHDHYGNSEYLENRPHRLLATCLRFCDGAVVVNRNLENWLRSKLKFKKTLYLPNFATLDKTAAVTQLFGIEHHRIICLANLREQKNHVLLVQVAAKIKKSHPLWTFHLVGKDFDDDYSKMIKEMIQSLNVSKSVFIYGSCKDTVALVEKCDIGILTSKSEGLPVALLEYGLLSKPVLATSVGEIPSIIEDGENGYLAPSENDDEFYQKLVALIEDDNRLRFGKKLNGTILTTYNEKFIIETYLKWLKDL